MGLALLLGLIIESIMGIGKKANSMASGFIFRLRRRRNLESGLMGRGLNGLVSRRLGSLRLILILIFNDKFHIVYKNIFQRKFI